MEDRPDQYSFDTQTVKTKPDFDAGLLKTSMRVTMKIVSNGAVSTTVLLVFIGLTDSITASRNCRSVEFRCQNGDCIASKKLCDGRADCSDQSDETRDECTKPQSICSEHAFRCDYGACVNGDSPCDGIVDCLDRSDELLPRCQVSKTERRFNAIQLGELISVAARNDSASIDLCRSKRSPTRTTTDRFDIATTDRFAIVTTDRYDIAKTDRFDVATVSPWRLAQSTDRFAIATTGRFDVATVSPWRLAQSTDRFAIATTGRFDVATVSPWRLAQSTLQPLSPCQIPSQPQNGRWQLYKSQCPRDEHCNVHSVYALVPGTRLIYSCANGYRIRGSEDVFCGPEGKWSNKPVCVEIRCKPLVSASIEADSCMYNDKWASCESAVLPRTIATISCRNGYHQEYTFLSTQRNDVRCNATGQWEPDPIRCIPKCGITTTTSIEKTPLVVNGELPELSDFPWHATLYKREGSVMEFKCGATIIQNDLLITAAHCVYDETRQRVDDANKFAVATGNIFRDYDSSLHNPTFVKKARVARIYVSCRYVGLAGNYARDIAILHIQTPFVFSALLMPACLDPFGYGDQSALEVGKKGKVAGFGKTSSGKPSEVLQYLTVPVVSLDECIPRDATPDTVALFTIDKLCAGYTNGSAVCDGDSGGGLVFKKEHLWYLRGIVSVGVGQIVSGGTRRCNEYKESLYTKISTHIEWIKDVIIKLEMFNTYPVCPNRTMSYP